MTSRNRSTANHGAEFPHNLTPAEHRAVQAVIEHGKDKPAAAAIGVGLQTLRAQTQAARDKAGVNSTVRLVVLYLRSQPKPVREYITGYDFNNAPPNALIGFDGAGNRVWIVERSQQA